MSTHLEELQSWTRLLAPIILALRHRISVAACTSLASSTGWYRHTDSRYQENQVFGRELGVNRRAVDKRGRSGDPSFRQQCGGHGGQGASIGRRVWLRGHQRGRLGTCSGVSKHFEHEVANMTKVCQPLDVESFHPEGFLLLH